MSSASDEEAAAAAAAPSTSTDDSKDDVAAVRRQLAVDAGRPSPQPTRKRSAAGVRAAGRGPKCGRPEVVLLSSDDEKEEEEEEDKEETEKDEKADPATGGGSTTAGKATVIQLDESDAAEQETGPSGSTPPPVDVEKLLQLVTNAISRPGDAALRVDARLGTSLALDEADPTRRRDYSISTAQGGQLFGRRLLTYYVPPSLVEPLIAYARSLQEPFSHALLPVPVLASTLFPPRFIPHDWRQLDFEFDTPEAATRVLHLAPAAAPFLRPRIGCPMPRLANAKSFLLNGLPPSLTRRERELLILLCNCTGSATEETTGRLRLNFADEVSCFNTAVFLHGMVARGCELTVSLI